MSYNSWARRDFVRRGFASVVVLGFPTLFTSCGEEKGDGADGSIAGDRTLKRIQETGAVRVGFSNDEPYSFKDSSGKLTGQAPTVVEEIFSDLGVQKMEGVLVDWDSLIFELNRGQFDLIAAGMFIQRDRCQKVAFSNPDYCRTSAFGVASGNPFEISTFEDIAADEGIVLGVMKGTPGELLYPKDAGIAGDQVAALPNLDEMFQALIDGGVDAIFFSTAELNWRHQQNFGNAPIEITDGFIPVHDGEEIFGCGGYAFRQKDADLVDRFNTSLRRLQESGRLLQLLKPFGFTSNEIRMAMEHTSKELCST